ncbi:MAG: Ribosomal protein [Thermoleophilia bacterium]|nr:Ribosomal protein [Thermoleophilia bacterium]
MKTRDFQELKKKDADELEALVVEKHTEVMNLRFSHATGALEDSARLGAARRDVARMMTVLGEKRRAAKNEVTA